MSEKKKLTDEATELAIEKTNKALKVSKKLSDKYNKFVDDNIENIVQMSKARKYEKEMILEFIHRLQEDNKNYDRANSELMCTIYEQKAEIERLTKESDEMFDRHAKENQAATILLEQRNKEISEQKAEIERLTEYCGMFERGEIGSPVINDKMLALEKEKSELQKKVENQKTVIKGQNKTIEKEKAENKRLYDEYVRLDDFCATKGCICCVCEKKKTCKECSRCQSLKTEKCNSFKINIIKYTRAIERVEKLQKQVDKLKEINEKLLCDNVAYKDHIQKIDVAMEEVNKRIDNCEQQAVKDTAKEILDELENRKQYAKDSGRVADKIATDIAIKVVKEIAKSKGVEVE